MALGKREAMIYSLVTVNKITSIDQIASTLGVTPKKALTIIQKMINTSNAEFDFFNEAILFKNAQIDHINNKIVLDPASANRRKNSLEDSLSQLKNSISQIINPPSQSKTPQPQESPHSSYPNKKTVTCSGCGAENTISAGTDAVCEYCGTALY